MSGNQRRQTPGAGGFEPPHGRIKIQVVRTNYQRAFRKIAEIRHQSVQEVSEYFGMPRIWLSADDNLDGESYVGEEADFICDCDCLSADGSVLRYLCPTLDSVQRGLDAVTIAADQICNVLKIESTSEDVKEDEVKTELRGLIKQLADLGIADPGIMNAQGEYAGAFQTDDFSSTSTLIYSADCKHQVFDRLTNHLLGEGSAIVGAAHRTTTRSTGRGLYVPWRHVSGRPRRADKERTGSRAALQARS
jgi:hypothetical protein